MLVSSIQLSFHLTKKLQGGIGLVLSQEAVSQSWGYLPVCLGQLSGHSPTGGDSLGMSGQSCCSCCSSAVSCKSCSELLHPRLRGRCLLIFGCSATFRGVLQLLGFCSAMSIPLLLSLGGPQAPAHSYIPVVPELPAFLPVLPRKHNSYQKPKVSTQDRKRTG